MPKTLAIGDIHGARTALECLLDWVAPAADDTLVTLGDYVDRGPDSKGTIELLISLQDQLDLIPLRGNHEVMLLQARHAPKLAEAWLECGGRETLASYGQATVETIQSIPDSHWSFIGSTALYHQTPSHIFAHANIDPGLPLDQQEESTLLWDFLMPDRSRPRHISGKTLVCGHSPQPTYLPLDLRTAIVIDTDPARGGWLTCLDTATGEYWQADECSRRRRGILPS